MAVTSRSRIFPYFFGFYRWTARPGGERDGGGAEPEEQSRAAGKGTRKKTQVQTQDDNLIPPSLAHQEQAWSLYEV